MARIAIIVPCRLESTRFPRKLLHKIKGTPLLAYVAQRIASEAPEFPLYFAVDHELLKDCVVSRGFQAIMTRPDHPSGTDRIAEANRIVGAECVVNVQADEPLVTGTQIRLLAELISGVAEMATLATPFVTLADFRNTNQVKVVCDAAGQALYFSRAPIPHPRDHSPNDAWVREHPCYHHLGMYAYKAQMLERLSQMPPGRLEQIEKLEQLRVLENGISISVGLVGHPGIGVDTPEDARKYESLIDSSR